MFAINIHSTFGEGICSVYSLRWTNKENWYSDFADTPPVADTGGAVFELVLLINSQKELANMLRIFWSKNSHTDSVRDHEKNP